MIQAVLFDFRDTLLNVQNSYKKSFDFLYEVVKDLQNPVSKKDLDKKLEKSVKFVKTKYSGKRNIHDWNEPILKELFRKLEIKMSQEKFRKFLDRYDLIFSKHAKLYPDSRDILNFLKKKNIRMGVIIDGTSKRERSIIRKLGLERYLNSISISEEVGKNKFTPFPLKKALNEIKTLPELTIVIGDRIDKDISHANKLGCISIKLERHSGRYTKTQALSEKERPKFIIKSLKELKKYVN